MTRCDTANIVDNFVFSPNFVFFLYFHPSHTPPHEYDNSTHTSIDICVALMYKMYSLLLITGRKINFELRQPESIIFKSNWREKKIVFYILQSQHKISKIVTLVFHVCAYIYSVEFGIKLLSTPILRTVRCKSDCLFPICHQCQPTDVSKSYFKCQNINIPILSSCR